MNLDRFKITILCTAAILAPAVVLAQDPMAPPSSATMPNPQQRQSPATSSMQDAGPNDGDTGQIMKDKMFLRGATEGGLAEVQFGQLAAQKGGSEDVKAFGQKMVTDHTALNAQLAPIADSMGIRVSKSLNKENQAEYDKLNSLSGDAFDTEYLTLMVKDHHKDLREFRMEATMASDQNLRDAVAKGQQVVREHTMMVDKLARDKGLPVPGRGGNRQAPPAQ
jgi:putative membrane protein